VPQRTATATAITAAAAPDRPSAREVLARPAVRQVARFAIVGVASTALYSALFLLLREALDTAYANAAALVLSAIFNTAVNRRATFGVRGRDGLLRHYASGFAALGIALLITSGAVAIMAAVAPGAPRLVELAVLAVANAVATAARFLVLRSQIRA
jgi:putative flippase GtrA